MLFSLPCCLLFQKALLQFLRLGRGVRIQNFFFFHHREEGRYTNPFERDIAKARGHQIHLQKIYIYKPVKYIAKKYILYTVLYVLMCFPIKGEGGT